MVCNNWVRRADYPHTDSDGNETEITSVEDGGYQQWKNGSPVTFWWFDGRD